MFIFFSIIFSFCGFKCGFFSIGECIFGLNICICSSCLLLFVFNFGFFNRAMFKRVIESRISGFAKLGISTQKLAGLGSGIAVVVIVAFLISMVFGRDESPTTPSAELPRAPELMLDVPGEAAESSNEPTAVAIDSQGQTENQLQSKSKN